jgi:hypothetical protein
MFFENSHASRLSDFHHLKRSHLNIICCPISGNLDISLTTNWKMFCREQLQDDEKASERGGRSTGSYSKFAMQSFNHRSWQERTNPNSGSSGSIISFQIHSSQIRPHDPKKQ